MKIVSISEILQCNEFLKEKNLGFRIHLKDACGKQSCYIESLREENKEAQYEALYKALDEFFQKMRFRLEYGENKTNFWIE